MKSIEKLDTSIPVDLKNELNLLLTNTALSDKDQAELIELINKIFQSY